MEEKQNQERFNHDLLKIEPLKTSKSLIKQRPLMENHMIPSVMTSTIIVGKSGSGKTCCLVNMLSKPHMYGTDSGGKPYFDDCIVFSKTACKGKNAADDAYECVDWLEPHHFVNDFQIEQIDTIFEEQIRQIESRGFEKAPSVLLLFDDCLSEPKFLRSKQFRRLFTESRHAKLTIFINTQSLNAIERTARLNANAVIFFASAATEVEALCDSFCPPFLTKREFTKVVEYACDEPYSFLFINLRAPHGKQYRKRFDEIIDVNQFRKKR